MHLPRALARFNRHVTNPIQRRWAGVIPLHGIVEHTGRKSGRAYRTPVLVFGETAEGEGQALGVGADLYVRQPLTARALLTALAEALVREAEDVRAVA